jgi:broad specificity phosphatase PhoE
MMRTRWWWVRHAPVTANDGRLYGASDPPADLGDAESLAALAATLPGGAVWVTSHLRRARETAAAIRAHGVDGEEPATEPAFGEQNFGAWQGVRYDELHRRRDKPAHRFWFTTAAHRPPGGETYEEVMARVVAAIERLTARHSGRDIVAVGHGGSIRAAIAHALALDAERALAFVADNLSLTRLDRLAGGAAGPDWQVHTINRPARSLPGVVFR